MIVGLGGQTPLKLARVLEQAGIPVLGTSPTSIDLAEDRERFNALCDRLGIPQPEGRHGGLDRRRDPQSRRTSAIRYWSARHTFSAVGRWRSSSTTTTCVTRWRARAAGWLGREGGLSAERPALIDRFLEDAVEVDVDTLRDHTGEILIGGGDGAHRTSRGPFR